jgi:hypothetical protein
MPTAIVQHNWQKAADKNMAQNDLEFTNNRPYLRHMNFAITVSMHHHHHFLPPGKR